MKRSALLITTLLLVQLHAAADDTFRAAALAELRRTVPAIAESDVSLLASPPLLAPVQQVKVATARYDSGLERWQLQLQCVPRQACLPTVAFVRLADANLFRPSVRANSPTIIHAGDRKELVSFVGPIRLLQSVTCLQSARAGETVRVRERGGKRIWIATANSDGSLTLGSRP